MSCKSHTYENGIRRNHSHKIIGCAYNVFNQLGFGFLESVYKKAMIIELAKSKLKAEEEKPMITGKI
ncbi:MAG: GxxExxY protein [Pseudomonadota bacterium]